MVSRRRRSLIFVELSFQFSVYSFQMGSRSYKDLVVWQKSIALCKLMYLTCESFPKSELYGLASQMKRAAVSVASNIAEGQARQHLGEFRSVSRDGEWLTRRIGYAANYCSRAWADRSQTQPRAG